MDFHPTIILTEKARKGYNRRQELDIRFPDHYLKEEEYMKKAFSMLLVLAVLVGCLAVSTTSVFATTGNEDYCWVVRTLEIDEDFFTADEVKLNLKLWWQWGSDEIVPYTIKVKNVQLYVDGTLTENWIPSADASLELGRDDLEDPEPRITDEEGVVIEEGTTKGTDYQLNMWSNGTTPVAKGKHTVEIRILAAVYSEDDYWADNMVRVCLWNEENGQPFKETFAATEGDGEPISFDDWEEGGTEGFNTPKPEPTVDPNATPTPDPTTAAPTTAKPTTAAPKTTAPATSAPATSAPADDAPVENDNSGMIIAIVVIAVVVIAGVVVLLVVKKKK